MSVQDTTTFHGESTSPLFGHSTAWNIMHKGRPFYAVTHHSGTVGESIRIDALDTLRPVQTTSKRGVAIAAMVRAAYLDRFNDVDLDDLPVDDEDGDGLKL